MTSTTTLLLQLYFLLLSCVVVISISADNPHEQPHPGNYKSETTTPEPERAGVVNVVTGNTFRERVLNSDKDSFIMIYAPWGGHCKAARPKLEEAAKLLADRFDAVSIQQMDGTENDVVPEAWQAYRTTGFPTFYYAKKGEKMFPITYDGPRTVEGFKSFVAKQVMESHTIYCL